MSLIALLKSLLPSLFLGGLISLIPGILISTSQKTFQRVPGLLTLVPALIGMRGNIFGSLAARYSTLIQVKHYSPTRLRKQIEFLASFALCEVAVLSFLLPLALFFVFPSLFDHSIWLPLTISSMAGAVSGIIMNWATLRLLKLSLQFRLSPDNTVPPLITALGDLITLPILLSLCSILLGLSSVSLVTAIIGFLSFTAFSLVRALLKAWRLSFSTELRRLALERLPVLTTCMCISLLAGMILEQTLADWEEPSSTALGYLSLLPLLNATGGAAGAAAASTLSTHMIQFSRSRSAAPSVATAFLSACRDGTVAILSVFLTLLSIGVALFAYMGLLTTYSFTQFLVISVAMALLLGVASSLLTVAAVLISIRFSMNPDSVAVPVVCAIMDCVSSFGFLNLIKYFDIK